ncbi:hypothetical protein ATL39_0139 [Sinobaca qinghaiensis]|uniref:Uncharacterized protein n=1 Tax=Sinobaca qinghaiensis TaxID=342944 RepID=A0A419V7M1_9BACL|nr:hypothetical protein [Sinobaca qinghaiensis]RKD75929.1 hypothetical protein ATL39_0139 [Sinobaca qinghaiensis]
MNIHLIVFIHSAHETHPGEVMTKTYSSSIRPAKEDIISDNGFHPGFHNGYEVVKVTLDYSKDECWVSLSPLAIEIQDIPVEEYLNHLKKHGWKPADRLT